MTIPTAECVPVPTNPTNYGSGGVNQQQPKQLNQYSNQYSQPYQQTDEERYYATHILSNNGSSSYQNGAYYDVESQHLLNNSDVSEEENNPWEYLGNDAKKQFILKVYTILFLQLLVTFGVALLFCFYKPAKEIVLNSPNLVLLSVISTFIFLIALMCYQRSHPYNYILLFLFTLSESYLIGTVCCIYEEQGLGSTVLTALALTMSLFVGLSLFTLQSKIDFSPLGAILSASLCLLLCFGFICWLFGFNASYLYSLASAIKFTLFIIYDTWALSEALGPDDYIVGAISLYLDVINLFLDILRLLTSDRD